MASLNFTPEQMEAAKNAKSPEELVSKAKEQGIEISPEQAKAFLARTKEGELADEELENVAGGYCHDNRGREIVTLITPCVHGLEAEYNGGFFGSIKCGEANNKKYQKIPRPPSGKECKYLSYEKGIWYCNYNVMPH